MYFSSGSQPSCTRDQTDFSEVKEWEVQDALNEMKNGKAPGRSNITVVVATSLLPMPFNALIANGWMLGAMGCKVYAMIGGIFVK